MTRADFLVGESNSGHCEVFAAALTAMARSIGMKARVVTGYRAGEYNRIGGYYIVRQSNAHAWTEIHLGPRGWKTFDAKAEAYRPSQTEVNRMRENWPS